MQRRGSAIIFLLILLSALLMVGGYYLVSSRKNGLPDNAAPGTIDTSSWKIYGNNDLGFKAKYPSGWIPGLLETDTATSKQTSVSLMKEYQSGDAQIPVAAVAFFIQYGADSKNLSIHDWAIVQMKNVNASSTMNDTTLGGQPAVLLTAPDGEKFFFARTNDADILTVSYKPDPQFDQIYQAILSSITFTR